MAARISANSEHFLKQLKHINECIEDAKLERDYDLQNAPEGTDVDFTDVALNNLKSKWISLRQLETPIKACTEAAILTETCMKIKRKFYQMNSPGLNEFIRENANKSIPFFDFLPPQKQMESRNMSEIEITLKQNKNILEQLHKSNSQDHEMLMTQSKMMEMNRPVVSYLRFFVIAVIAVLISGGLLYSRTKGNIDGF